MFQLLYTLSTPKLIAGGHNKSRGFGKVFKNYLAGTEIRHHRGKSMVPCAFRVQKKSRFHGSELEEDFAVYVVFEEGLVMCINNPVSTKFSINVKSTVKGIALLQYNFSTHAQCRVQEVWLFLTF